MAMHSARPASAGASHPLSRAVIVIGSPQTEGGRGDLSPRPAPQRRWHARTKHAGLRQVMKQSRDKSVAGPKTRILVCDLFKEAMLLRNLGKSAVRVTEIGFGGAPLGNLFAVVTEQDAQASLKAAWDSGCRYFDTAPLYGYGLSERRVGDALREKPRDQFVLSTRVGRLVRPGMGRDSGAGLR